MGNNTESQKAYLFLAVITFLFLIFVGSDVFFDYAAGGSMRHIIIELLLFCVSLVGLIISLVQLFRKSDQVKQLTADLAAMQRDKEKWRSQSQKLMRGLSAKIQKQFQDWQLTEAEISVGFLLIKGFSQKEIAELRGTHVKTVQHQSQNIYRKANLTSRTELAAFFLEDLLPAQE